MESCLPTSDFPDQVILLRPSGGVELALALPENARKYCIAAARFYRDGEDKAAKDLFLAVLKSAVSPVLGRQLRFYTVPQLALLASHLLNVKFSVLTPQQKVLSAEAVEKSLRRLFERQKQ